MGHLQRGLALVGAAALCAACVTAPTGPDVMALPGSGKSFASFQVDDRNCRDWAADRIGIAPGQAAGQSAASGAVIGTAIGAAAGTLIGVAAHDPGAGAAIGAGAGLLVGSANGAAAGEASAASLQRRYDMAYTQCMYANGNQVPVAGRPAAPYGARSSPPPPPRRERALQPPPPPIGAPPPPPAAAPYYGPPDLG
jgi:hypothetical protein